MTVPTLVAAIDLDTNSAHVIDKTLELAQLLSARVAFVHVMALAPGVRPETVVAAPGRDPAPAAELLEADARKHTDAILSMFQEVGVPTELVLRHGDLPKAVAEVAREQGAVMVLLGAPRKSLLPRLWGQDVCSALVENCTAPVLLVRRTKKAEETYSTAQFQMLAEVDG